jgi:hypothetical protein
VPAGVELIAGAQTRNLGTLGTNSSPQTFTWTVRGDTDGVKSITAQAQASRYGETFASTATDAFTVDATGPAPTIAAPKGTTAARSLDVAWGATDAHSTVAHFDVESSVDGAPWVRWLTSTPVTGAAYRGDVGHRYRFRVRATDNLGNASGWLESTETTIADPPTAPSPPSTTSTSTKVTPKLALAGVKRTRTAVTVQGSVDAAATGNVTVSYSTKIGRTTYRSRLVAKLDHGQFKATLRLAAKARRARRGTVEVRYDGDSAFKPRTVRRAVVTR